VATDYALARRRLTLVHIKARHRATVRGLAIEEAAELRFEPQDLVGEFCGPHVINELLAWAHP
jgi:hypothetical protein